MKDDLKLFIDNNRDGFKETPPAIAWTNIENELKKNKPMKQSKARFTIKTKNISTMLKYGFGASVLIIGTVAILNLKKENTSTSLSSTAIPDTIIELTPAPVKNEVPPPPTPLAVSTSTDPVKINSQSTKANNLVDNKVFPPDTIDQTAMMGVGSAAKDSYTGWTDNSTGQMICCCRSVVKKIEGFSAGILSTDETNGVSDIPKKYLGKRIRYSGYIKTEDVAEWAGLWLRVGKKGGKEALAFDNMRYGKKDRGIRGTTPWTKYEIVVDVPMNASNILYGCIIAGTGEIRFHTTVLEIVDTSVPVTAELLTSYPGVQKSDRYRSFHPNDFWKWYVPGHTILPDGTWQVDYRD